MADEVLFDKELRTIVKSRESDESPRRHQLGVQVSLRASQRELRVRLTSQDDSCLLYTLQIGSDDFLSLKSQQGLLVDFSAFPNKFTDLLELCRNNETEREPKFLLQFVISSSSDRGVGTLSVVETNPFKHLTHLSLKLVPGSDAAIKQYLSDCLKESRRENVVLRERFASIESNLSQQLNQTEQTLKSRCSELESMRLNWSVEKGQLISKHAEELGAAKEQALTVQREAEERHMIEKQRTESDYQSTVKELERRVSTLQSSAKELTELKYKNDLEIRELVAKAEASETESGRSKSELDTLRGENSRLDAACHEKDKLLHQLKTRLAVLEQEVKDKEEIVTRTSSLLQLSGEQKAVAEGLVEEKERVIAKLESTRQTLAADVAKGNEIILTLKQELKNFKEKFKLKNVVLMKQEQILTDRLNELERQKLDIETLTRTLAHKEEELATCQEDLKADRSKLMECQEKLKSNENVISWLNRQINDQYLGQPLGPPKPLDLKAARGLSRAPLGSLHAPNAAPTFTGDAALHQKIIGRRSRLPVPARSTSSENRSLDAPGIEPSGGSGGGVLDPQYLMSLSGGRSGRRSLGVSPEASGSVPVTSSASSLDDLPQERAPQPPILSSYFPN
ncbi:spindle assembly abnormal protein 6 homolog [Oscarella lobularis]|uniref:spindle assembly abnormal protein 6 homolog n=1 Tax=Oscarella lobularis TaxID=121494 RepID=UPI003313FF80